MHVYTVESGRNIFRDGKPFVYVQKQSGTYDGVEVEYVCPSDADNVTRRIVDLLNADEQALARCEAKHARDTAAGA
jgi:hypothetical protein